MNEAKKYCYRKVDFYKEGYVGMLFLRGEGEERFLFPLDLKNGLADWIIEKLEPARKHFERPEVKEGLAKMREFLAKK